MLLCPIHHTVVDADTEAYTVERLQAMKTGHEAGHAGGKEATEAVAMLLILSIDSPTITGGSIIFTQNQMGGQVAHTIKNVGLQPRSFSGAAANILVAELKRHPPERYELFIPAGNGEAHRLAVALDEALRLAGWMGGAIHQDVVVDPPVHGIRIETPNATPALVALLNWCGQVALKPEGALNKNGTLTEITIGHQV